MTIYHLVFNFAVGTFQRQWLVLSVCTGGDICTYVLIYAKEVWREIKPMYGFQLRRNFFTNPKSWVFDFLARSTERECMVLTVMIWHLWLARNGVRNGENMKPPQTVAEQSKVYIEMIEQHLFSPDTSNIRETRSSAPRWSPPPEGTVYVNVDVAEMLSLHCRVRWELPL
jgi:hypothetical protein